MATNAPILAPAALLLLAAGANPAPAAPEDPLSRRVVLIPIAMTGTDGPLGPGMGAGVSFESFRDPPQITPSGAVAFHARISRDDLFGIWLWQDAGLVPIALEKDDQLGPGLGANSRFSWISRMALASEGAVAFSATVAGAPASEPVAQDVALWLADGAGPRPIVALQTDGPLGPGLGSGRYFHTGPGVASLFLAPFAATSGSPVFLVNETESGAVAVQAGPDGPRYFAGNHDDMLRPLGPGSRWGYFSPSTTLCVNRHGMTALSAKVLDAQGRVAHGVWRLALDRAPEMLVLQYEDGGPGSVTPGGLRFFEFREVSIDAIGRVAFNATARGPGLPDTSTHSHTWVFEEGAITAIDLEPVPGSVAPEFGLSAYGATTALPVINSRGGIAFAAGLDSDFADDPTGGIWHWRDGALEAVAIDETDGPLGPALGPGAVFLAIPPSRFRPAPSINTWGDLAFHARASRNEVWHEGAWVSADRVLRPVVIDGTSVDIDPSTQTDLRNVAMVAVLTQPEGFGVPSQLAWGSGGEDGRPSFLSDTRELALLLDFSDGSSGIFKARYFDPCPGDFNADSLVAADDLGMMLSAFGTADSLTDLNADGIVNTADLGALLLRFGRDCAAG